MKRTKLLMCPPCEAPQKKDTVNVIAVSQIIEVDEEKAVEVSLFYMGVLKGRYFANKENYTAWVNGKWHNCKIKNAARLCKGLDALKNDYYYIGREMEWDSKGDEDRVLDFLDTWSIDSYEGGVNTRKWTQALRRKQKRIDEKMAEVPCVPEEVENWIEQTFFPGHILFFKKGEKRTEYTCTACGCSSWKKAGWKHGERTVCPKCRQPVTANSRQREKSQKVPIIILQQYGKEWVERQFKAVCRWGGREKEIRLLEECRAIIPKGKCWGTVWYGTLEGDEFEQEFWDRNPRNKHFLSSYLYPGNLKEVLKCGNLERSGMDILAENGKKINVNRFITNFHNKPYLEYLIKAGLSCLAVDIVEKIPWIDRELINETGKTLREALRLDGNRINRLKQLNGNMLTLKWLQYEERAGIKISQDSLQYLSDKKIPITDCESMLKELKSVNRMVNYIKKQKLRPSKTITVWRDYLRMAEEEGYDVTDDIVRFPKDLKARHDQLVEIRNARIDKKRLEKEKEKYRKLDARILKRLPQAAQYYWENDRYMIVPAGKCQELITEGRALHHCVGSSDIYMEKMAAGKSWILFLRRKKELEKPYYTIEIDMKENRIQQYYSEFDRQPDKAAITRVLDEFRRSIGRKRVNATAYTAG